eukprot:CAMPEP_0174938268 /NCGR_PEP_ID=MMETSP1355-20121228/62979_1 /TAXON_ID=464990 /ORGANISM="Hemiselmis tepida, Strain CCMP443" /LENGTH=232 /DNA_ID=CAMNT_0016185183 /DNA_START=266 /DNA_END=959 /DNA_ORIENTATION=-
MQPAAHISTAVVVVLASHEQLGGAVGTRHDVVGETDVVILVVPLRVEVDHGPSNAEVAYLQPPERVKENVAGLEVPVDDAARVHVREAPEELPEEAADLLPAEEVLRVQHEAEIDELQIREQVHVDHVPPLPRQDVARHVGLYAEVHGRDDVGVPTQPPEDRQLPLQPVCGQAVWSCVPHALDRHARVRLEVFAPPHDGKGALAGDPPELVPVRHLKHAPAVNPPRHGCIGG